MVATRDLAKLYQCRNGTKEINQAVKNNIDKFPERFSFVLSEEKMNIFDVKNFDLKEKKVVVEDIYREFLRNKGLQCLRLY